VRSLFGVLVSVHPEMVHLARVQGGQQIQTGDVWLIFRGFEFAAQRRNRVRGAVSGWALVNKFPIEAILSHFHDQLFMAECKNCTHYLFPHRFIRPALSIAIKKIKKWQRVSSALFPQKSLSSYDYRHNVNYDREKVIIPPFNDIMVRSAGKFFAESPEDAHCG
jgi:hypothetical protein